MDGVVCVFACGQLVCVCRVNLRCAHTLATALFLTRLLSSRFTHVTQSNRSYHSSPLSPSFPSPHLQSNRHFLVHLRDVGTPPLPPTSLTPLPLPHQALVPPSRCHPNSIPCVHHKHPGQPPPPLPSVSCGLYTTFMATVASLLPTSAGTSHGPSSPTSPVKNDQDWPVLPGAAAPLTVNAPAVFTASKACAQAPSSPQSSAPSAQHSATSSRVTSPVGGNVNAFPHTNNASVSSSIRRFVCRSTFMTPFVMERAARAPVVLPPSIHLLYSRAAAQMQGANSQRATCNGSLRTPTASEPTAVHGDAAPQGAVSALAAAGGDMPQGDVFYLTWLPREVAEMRRQQRGYQRLQRRSPFAPQLVRPDKLAASLLNDGAAEDMDGAAPLGPDAAASAVAGLCTLGIPQQEYLKCVLHHRVNVLQQRTDAIPVGVVVPAIVEPTQTLDELAKERRIAAAATRLSRDVPSLAASEMQPAEPLPSSTPALPTVTYPHPGRPFTYRDVVQDPQLLTAEQRADCRAALLHRRTLSEVYGEPALYM